MRYGVVALAGGWTIVGASAMAQSPLVKQIRNQYPQDVANFQARCLAPKRLEIKRVQQETAPTQTVSFTCWQRQQNGDRAGSWLGYLPLPQSVATFAQPMTCAPDDKRCVTTLAQVKSQQPGHLKHAEFKCATQNGSLFFNYVDQTTVELRCGFMDSQLYDPAGNGDRDIVERFTSIDIPVATFKLQS